MPVSGSSPRIAVLFLGDQWDIQWRRRQQIAWRLAHWDACVRLLYVETPLTLASLRTLLRTRDPDAQDRWRRLLRTRKMTAKLAPKLEVFTPIALLPGLGLRSTRSQDILAAWLLRRRITQFRNSLSPGVRLVLWTSLPHTSPEVLSWVEPDLLWYDVTEDFAATPGLPAKTREHLQANDALWTRSADIVSAVSSQLYKRKQGEARTVLHLPNAVDTSVFAVTQPSDEPPDLAALPRPRVAFVGGVPASQDWGLVRFLAQQRPDWSFVFLGNLKPTPPELTELPSVYFLGPKAYHQLPSYLEHCDACIQMYRPDALNDSRNAQKLFVYLAAGRPVVSTRSADAEEFAENVAVADTPQEFLEKLEHEMAWDSPERQAARRAFIAQHSWDRRVETIVDTLHQVMMERVPSKRAQTPE